MDNEEALKRLINMYSELETELLDEIVTHFNINEEFINSDYWRFEKLKELGLLNQNIVNYIAKVTNKSPDEIEIALKNIGQDSLNMNKLNEAYRGGYLRVDPSILVQNQTIENMIKYAYDELTNRFLEIAPKIEQATREAYLDTIEKAYIQMQSGGLSYQQAIRNALLDLGDKGITTLTYKTMDDNGNIVGIRNYDVEATIRRELVTASHDLTNKINKAVAEELDIEYLYLSEHVKCRPTHFPWQGTIIKREDLERVTGYGEVDGLGGPNCKHYHVPYFGKARGNDLKQISEDEAIEQYLLSQKQRYLERGIRRWKRKQRIFKTAEDKETYDKCKEKVKWWQLRNRKFIEENNIKRDFSRENVEKMTAIKKDDIIRPNYIRHNTYKNYDSSQDEKNIDSAINRMPTKISEDLKNTEFEIITKGITDKDYSRYDRKTNKFYIYQDATEEEIIHEIGHYIETRYNVISDERYIDIRNKGLSNYSIFAVDDLPGYDNIKGIKNEKFISIQQGRIYRKDLDSKSYIGKDGLINLNCLGEYFSEGFREYHINPNNLMKHDIDLYNYIKEVLDNVK